MSLSNVVNNISERIHKLNLNIDMMIKNAIFAKISISIVSVFLNI